jgi:hypothetical protein
VLYHICHYVHYDKYYIVEYTATIPVEQKQPYDKYDIAHITGTIPVEQKQLYGVREN